MIDFLKSLNVLLDRPLHKPAAANDISPMVPHRHQAQTDDVPSSAAATMAAPASSEPRCWRQRA
jgi:hypothetical protein